MSYPRFECRKEAAYPPPELWPKPQRPSAMVLSSEAGQSRRPHARPVEQRLLRRTLFLSDTACCVPQRSTPYLSRDKTPRSRLKCKSLGQKPRADGTDVMIIVNGEGLIINIRPLGLEAGGGEDIRPICLRPWLPAKRLSSRHQHTPITCPRFADTIYLVPVPFLIYHLPQHTSIHLA